MSTTGRMARVAAAVGDPARAAMLQALMDGRSLTAGELAMVAGVAPQTASTHLANLLDAAVLTVERQGRHRYHRLASSEVAGLLESLMRVAAEGGAAAARPPVTGPRDATLRAARTCYDHLAGRLGVALADAMAAAGHVELTADAGVVTDAGVTFLRGIGVDGCELLAEGTRRSRRVLCRPCLDWSERRHHLAGTVGRALCATVLRQGWVRRMANTRAIEITPLGRRRFRQHFAITM